MSLLWTPGRRRLAPAHGARGARRRRAWPAAAAWIVVAATLTAVAPAVAQTPPLAPSPSSAAPSQSSPGWASAGADITTASSYVWRGFLESDKPCVQPGAWVSVAGVTAEFWMNLEAAEGRLHNAEYDLNLVYSRGIGPLTASGGVMNYFFDTPDGGRERHSEAMVSLAADTWLRPSLEAYHTVSGDRGSYVGAAVAHPMRLSARTSLTVEVAVGYNHRLWIAESGFTDLRTTLKVSRDLAGGAVRLDAGVDYNRALMDGDFANRVVGYVALTGER